jgi:hypothetical protein
MSLPSTSGAQYTRSCHPSPRRSHGALTEAGDFHASLWPRAMKVQDNPCAPLAAASLRELDDGPCAPSPRPQAEAASRPDINPTSPAHPR